MREISVRAAEPADIRFLAEVMYQSMLPGAGRGIFDIPLQGTGLDSIGFHDVLLRTGANNWGQLDSFLVLQDAEGRPAGAMGGFLSNAPDRRPLTAKGLELASAELEWSPEITRGFWRRYVSVFGLFGNAPLLAQPAEYVLEYAAVRSDLRGKGLYGLLLQAHTERARSYGYKSLGGTAMIGNDAVLRALVKFGFREHTRFSAEYYNGMFPGLIRLVYDL